MGVHRCIVLHTDGDDDLFLLEDRTTDDDGDDDDDDDDDDDESSLDQYPSAVNEVVAASMTTSHPITMKATATITTTRIIVQFDCV